VKGWVSNGSKVAGIEIECTGGFEDACGELLLGRGGEDMVRLAVAMGQQHLCALYSGPMMPCSCTCSG
jgi:hypothetical protein